MRAQGASVAVKDRGTRPMTTPDLLAEEAATREGVAALNKREFLDQFQKLSKQYAQDPGNPGSYACEGCQRCANCMFCKDCDSCHQCTHCTRCELCNNCSHCVDCKSCHASAYCQQSENCTHSAYLVLCRNMQDSNYCFGCVGLSKKDFHILNVPFPRTEYFKVVARLRKEMGMP
ncbi:caib/baif family protein [Corallococcus sp. M34]|nr:caib/baif family protein [Citreicoccus inhibens]